MWVNQDARSQHGCYSIATLRPTWWVAQLQRWHVLQSPGPLCTGIGPTTFVPASLHEEPGMIWQICRWLQSSDSTMWAEMHCNLLWMSWKRIMLVFSMAKGTAKTTQLPFPQRYMLSCNVLQMRIPSTQYAAVQPEERQPGLSCVNKNIKETNEHSKPIGSLRASLLGSRPAPLPQEITSAKSNAILSRPCTIHN